MAQAVTYTLETFVEEVRQIFATTKDPRTQAQKVARHTNPATTSFLPVVS